MSEMAIIQSQLHDVERKFDKALKILEKLEKKAKAETEAKEPLGIFTG